MKKFILALSILFITVGCITVPTGAQHTSDPVALLSLLNIMNGDGNGNYHLEKKVTRAEFTKMAVAASDSRNMVATGLKTSPYKDVVATHWASPYIKTAIDSGFCKGYTDSTFRPDNTVKYEEAVTILLRVLGYTDDDFGNSWPYGQIGLAENIGISDNAHASAGEELTRQKASVLIFNTLRTKMKNSPNKLISIFDTEIIEDVIVISVSDASRKEVHTSKGSFYLKGSTTTEPIGCYGELYVENGDTAIGFVPYDSSDSSEKQIVYSKLENDIITYTGNTMKALSVPASTPVYEDGVKTLFASKSQELEMGDILYVHRNSKNDPDYIIFEEGNVIGPITFSKGYNFSQFSGAKVLKNGELSAADKLNDNDIVYHVPDLNIIFSYSNKIVGIYENAEPNKDAPVYITVSGTRYKIEGDEAFKKLSSAGNLKYGDTITLLLGKSNDVADVLTGTQSDSTVCGYIYETGSKEYTKSDLSKYTSMYIKVVLPNGQIHEYQTDKDYKNLKNSVRKITFENGKAKPESVGKPGDIAGTFDYSRKTLGKNAVSDSLKIIDVSQTDSDKETSYVTVFPGRLDGVELSSDDILYCRKNSMGEIENLILRDVTGDAYSYGIVKKSKNNSLGFNLTGVYTLDINGNTMDFTSSGVLYSVQNGEGAKIDVTPSGNIQNIKSIPSIKEKITSVTQTNLTAGGNTYKISDNASVYLKTNDNIYTIIPLSEITGNNSYTLTAYYDKKPESGGMVRIIVATKK